MAEEKEEEKILGIWTREELVDDAVLALIAALAAFLSIIFWKAITAFVHEHKWFKEAES